VQQTVQTLHWDVTCRSADRYQHFTRL